MKERINFVLLSKIILRAGAILSHLKGTPSPEGEVCIQAFRNSEYTIAELVGVDEN